VIRLKKLAIGCGIALLIVGICGAGVAYYLYSRVSSALTQFAELGKVPEIERGVLNRDPFVPPTSGEVSDIQIEKLLKVQSAVRQRLGERMATLESKYKTLAEKEKADVTDAPALLRAYADLAVSWLDAKRQQVEALNATGLSLEEYRWIRDQTYRALGMAYVDLDIAKLVEDAKRGVTSEQPGQLRGAVEAAGPESNRTRAEKFRKQLESNIALASFGL
jgi:hypothetical protein